MQANMPTAMTSALIDFSMAFSICCYFRLFDCNDPVHRVIPLRRFVNQLCLVLFSHSPPIWLLHHGFEAGNTLIHFFHRQVKSSQRFLVKRVFVDHTCEAGNIFAEAQPLPFAGFRRDEISTFNHAVVEDKLLDD